MRERDIEKHLVEQVRKAGGEVRKVKWIGRRGAPDRVVMLPSVVRPRPEEQFVRIGFTVWVEVKDPETILTFPATAHERRQHREHKRMRAAGQRVEVVGTIEGVDAMLFWYVASRV